MNKAIFEMRILTVTAMIIASMIFPGCVQETKLQAVETDVSDASVSDTDMNTDVNTDTEEAGKTETDRVPPGMGDKTTVCTDYTDMCTENLVESTETPAACDVRCTDELNSSTQPSESCFFMACAIEVGFCDNEEDGDPSILACVRDNGWYSN